MTVERALFRYISHSISVIVNATYGLQTIDTNQQPYSIILASRSSLYEIPYSSRPTAITYTAELCQPNPESFTLTNTTVFTEEDLEPMQGSTTTDEERAIHQDVTPIPDSLSIRQCYATGPQARCNVDNGKEPPSRCRSRVIIIVPGAIGIGN